MSSFTPRTIYLEAALQTRGLSFRAQLGPRERTLRIGHTARAY